MAVAFGMGVVCLQQANQPAKAIDEFRQTGRVVVLFKEDGEGELLPNATDIFHLVNFLAAVQLRAALRAGELMQINLPLLQDQS